MFHRPFFFPWTLQQNEWSICKLAVNLVNFLTVSIGLWKSSYHDGFNIDVSFTEKYKKRYHVFMSLKKNMLEV